jgi:hypothetical protein
VYLDEFQTFHRQILGASQRLSTAELRLSQHRLDITGVPGFRPSLGSERPTMAELLAGSGYRTSCIAANALIRSENHLDPVPLSELHGIRIGMLENAAAAEALDPFQLSTRFGVTGRNLDPPGRCLISSGRAMIPRHPSAERPAGTPPRQTPRGATDCEC